VVADPARGWQAAAWPGGQVAGGPRSCRRPGRPCFAVAGPRAWQRRPAGAM